MKIAYNRSTGMGSQDPMQYRIVEVRDRPTAFLPHKPVEKDCFEPSINKSVAQKALYSESIFTVLNFTQFSCLGIGVSVVTII